MARAINKQLTRQMLEDMGICKVSWDYEAGNWKIERYWFRNSSKTIKDHIIIRISDAVCKHKYTTDKTYPIVGFGYKGKPQSIPLARFIYAWFRGEVKEGEVVDHKDNNPYNNMLSNLQVLTQEDNLHKRYKDNPQYNRNQWDVIHREPYKRQLLSKYYVAQDELVNVTNKLTEIEEERESEALTVMDKITDYIKNSVK